MNVNHMGGIYPLSVWLGIINMREAYVPVHSNVFDEHVYSYLSDLSAFRHQLFCCDHSDQSIQIKKQRLQCLIYTNTVKETVLYYHVPGEGALSKSRSRLVQLLLKCVYA